MTSVITQVWTDVMSWITTSLSSVQEVFYTTGSGGTGSLTFLGHLSVLSVAIGIAFLVIGVIHSFLRLR